MSCSSLTDVKIQGAVDTLGSFCFYGCRSLTDITLPSSLTSLGDNCFGGCISLTSLTIPDSVTSLDDNCFYNCTGLKSITLPPSLTSLEDYCFINCYSLTDITLPSFLTALGKYCFGYCSSLGSITIPSSVTSLGYSCFSGCSGLTDITFEGVPTIIGGDVLYGCSSLSTANIPIGSYNSFTGNDIDESLKETVLTLDGQGYSTICSITDLNFEGTDVTAYTAKIDDSKEFVTLSKTTQAAAGEGLVVNAEEAGTYVIPVATSELTNSTNNDLKGVKSTDEQPEIDPSGNYYALRSYTDGTVAFAKITSTLTFPRGKAYIQLSGTSAANKLAVNFGTATGIRNVTAEDETEGDFYNLSGVRVQNPTKGLYIRNGKKVFVK